MDSNSRHNNIAKLHTYTKCTDIVVTERYSTSIEGFLLVKEGEKGSQTNKLKVK